MPRKARIDAPGAFHHVIIRGIERKAIFKDDKDRDTFLSRLSMLLTETNTVCLAWSLMSNHVHLLLRTGMVPIASLMRRLLTGYAMGFNRRHRRHGHLFQNRYKSILCEEERYLQQLVAYLHLNPLRAGVIQDIKELNCYPYTGHSALIGKIARPWQDTAYVLSQFGRKISEARRNLQRAVFKGMSKGRNPEYTGGGLIRSAGGWRTVREAYRQGIRLVSDERILGSSEFVETVLKSAGDAYERRTRMKSAGFDLETVIDCACHHLGIAAKELSRPGRMRAIASARALIGYIAVTELAMPASEVARRMNVDRSSICRAIQRVGQNEKLITLAMEIQKLLSMRLCNNATTSP